MLYSSATSRVGELSKMATSCSGAVVSSVVEASNSGISNVSYSIKILYFNIMVIMQNN